MFDELPSGERHVVWVLMLCRVVVFRSSGFKDLEALKKHLVDNLIDSSIWGLTYLYIRRWANPETRAKTHTFVMVRERAHKAGRGSMGEKWGTGLDKSLHPGWGIMRTHGGVACGRG
jgi:hypothetical protein